MTITSGKSLKNPARRSKVSKLEWVGFVAPSSPSHRKVHDRFSQAGFRIIHIGINRDHSMATFQLSLGTHPAVTGKKQAHAVLHRLLCAAGLVTNDDDLTVDLHSGRISGAFVMVPQGGEPSQFLSS